MRQLKLFSIYLSIVVSLFGCASVGKVFNYQNRNKIEIGTTTEEQAIQLLGNPSTIENKSDKDGTYRILKYIYASAVAYSGGSSRLIWLEFKNGTLNAKTYLSNFKEDNTDYSSLNFDKIKIGESRKEDVINHLGNPSSIANCPSTFHPKGCNGASLVWIWSYTQKSFPGQLTKRKHIMISFDDNGVVVSTDFSEDSK